MKKIVLIALVLFLWVSSAGAQENIASQLYGSWESSPLDDVKFVYSYDESNKFTWVLKTQTEGDQQLQGTFVIEEKDGRKYVVFKDFSNPEFENMVIVTIIEFIGDNQYKMDGRNFTVDEIGEYPTEFTDSTLVFTKIME